MTRTSIRRVAIAGALAAVLTLAAPAHAAGWAPAWTADANLFQTTWQWVVSLWAPQPNAPHRVNGSATPEPGSNLKPRLKSDLGASADPNGAPSAATATCLTTLDRGCGIDPNG